jgi:hypothetical protein
VAEQHVVPAPDVHVSADWPLVSVILPTFNGAEFLRESLDSVLSQTYSRLEVLVMDDASTDGTAEVVRAYSDDRIRYHVHERNLGQFGNINAGVALARGDMIAIHHADDVYGAEILERELAFLQSHPAVGAAFALDLFIDRSGREFGRVALPDEFRGGGVLTYRQVLNGILRHGNTFIRGGTSLVRRGVYEEVGPFDESFDLRGDLDMWLRIAHRYSIGILDEHLTSYRWGHGNLSGHYGYLRTHAEHSFAVIDAALAGTGRELAEPDSIAAYEGRRSEDWLLVAVNCYVVRRRADSRRALANSAADSILRSPSLMRWRLLVLWASMQLLVRLPRLAPVARLFHRRWHGAEA